MMSRRAWGLLLLLALIWGTSFYFIEIGLLYVRPFTLVALRIGVGAMVLLVWHYASGARLPRDRQFWGACLVIGFLNNIIPFSLITWGQTVISGGLAAILNTNTTFFTVLCAALWLADERLRPHRIIGISLGFVGVVVVVGIQHLREINATNLGQLAILGAALSYALSAIWARLRLAHYPPLSAATCAVTCAAGYAIPLALVTDGVPSATALATPVMWLVLLCLGGFATACAYVLYFRILAIAGAANLSLVAIIIPIFAIILDAVAPTVSEPRVTATDLIGFLIIAFGLMITDGRLHTRIVDRIVAQRHAKIHAKTKGL